LKNLSSAWLCGRRFAHWRGDLRQQEQAVEQARLAVAQRTVVMKFPVTTEEEVSERVAQCRALQGVIEVWYQKYAIYDRKGLLPAGQYPTYSAEDDGEEKPLVLSALGLG
jgi:hypothetical protein